MRCLPDRTVREGVKESPAMSKMAGDIFLYMSINVEIQKNIFTDYYFFCIDRLQYL